MEKKTKAASTFSGKTVLVTGGTGSFGRAFVQKLIRQNQAEKVIVFSRDELKQWEMREAAVEFSSSKIRYFLGDIRDSERLKRAFHEVDIVVHAAALKQVPAAEYNPTESIKTNVIGAMNIINCAIDCKVEKVVALSSDKAVNPVNLYGATKLCSDKLFLAAGSYVGKQQRPLFSVVRYGNVLGSRGSLLPYWQKQLAAGSKTLPVTDKRMTRFWITLDEATDFVQYACTAMQGSEIFIPKSTSVQIVDLATAFSPQSEISFCGIRPGEKLHEVLISQDEARNTYETEESYVIIPHPRAQYPGIQVAEDFTLASNENPKFTTSQEKIKQLLTALEKEKSS